MLKRRSQSTGSCSHARARWKSIVGLKTGGTARCAFFAPMKNSSARVWGAYVCGWLNYSREFRKLARPSRAGGSSCSRTNERRRPDASVPPKMPSAFVDQSRVSKPAHLFPAARYTRLSASDERTTPYPQVMATFDHDLACCESCVLFRSGCESRLECPTRTRSV